VNVRLLKKRTLRFFFVTEIIAFVGLYLFGSNGIQRLLLLQCQQRELEQQECLIQGELAELNKHIAQLNETPFFKEKVAREQLQMAHEDDEIYYLS